LCERLADSRLPEGYADPDFVAERLVQILERRPRLAVHPDRVGLVFDWTRSARLEVGERGAGLIEQVEERL
jgi:hypothetical protein